MILSARLLLVSPVSGNPLPPPPYFWPSAQSCFEGIDSPIVPGYAAGVRCLPVTAGRGRDGPSHRRGEQTRRRSLSTSPRHTRPWGEYQTLPLLLTGQVSPPLPRWQACPARRSTTWMPTNGPLLCQWVVRMSAVPKKYCERSIVSLLPSSYGGRQGNYLLRVAMGRSRLGTAS